MDGIKINTNTLLQLLSSIPSHKPAIVRSRSTEVINKLGHFLHHITLCEPGLHFLLKKDEMEARCHNHLFDLHKLLEAPAFVLANFMGIYFIIENDQLHK